MRIAVKKKLPIKIPKTYHDFQILVGEKSQPIKLVRNSELM